VNAHRCTTRRRLLAAVVHAAQRARAASHRVTRDQL